MLFREQTPRGILGALIGLVEGVILGCGVLAVWYLLAGSFPLWLHNDTLVALAVLAGIVVALGRGVSGRMAGAGLGAVAGIFIGLPIALALPADWDVKRHTPNAGSYRPFDLSGPSLDGKQIDIADYRGKIVLVDFWATWCAPCVEEMPQVKEAYQRYHDQGFEIIGVSLDPTREPLEQFLSKNQISWPQIFFSNPTGQRPNPLVQQHKVDGIPTLFLINREGYLITRDLRGLELIAEIGRQVDPDTNGQPHYGANSAQIVPVRLILAVGSMLLLGSLLGALVQRQVMRGKPSLTAPQNLSPT